MHFCICISFPEMEQQTMYVHMHTCMHEHSHIHECTLTHTLIHAHTHGYTLTHTHVETHNHYLSGISLHDYDSHGNTYSSIQRHRKTVSFKDLTAMELFLQITDSSEQTEGRYSRSSSDAENELNLLLFLYSIHTSK